MTIAGDFITTMSFKGVVLSGVMGAATAAAYICYVHAFKMVGSPAFNVGYAMKLGLNGWFIIAVLFSATSILARPFLFELLGGQKGYFVMTGIGAVVATAVIVSFFRERFETYQIIGALMAICGSILVARG